MNFKNTHKLLKDQKGLAVVEFAIGVIVLLVLMLVTAELGRALYSYNTLTKSVRAGARYFSEVALDAFGDVDLDSPGPDGGLAKVTETQNVVVSGQNDNNGTPVLANFTIGDVTVSEIDPSPSGAGSHYISVSAAYTFVPIFASVPSLGIGDTSYNFGYTMLAASTMRVQR